MRSGISPQPMMTISAGAESSQRLMTARRSISSAAAAALDVAGAAEAGGGAEGMSAVSVAISVLQDLHGLGRDSQAHRIAHLQHVLVAAPVLHPDRHIPAGFQIAV